MKWRCDFHPGEEDRQGQADVPATRRRILWRFLSWLLVAGLLAACSGTNSLLPRTSIIGSRAAADPLAAAETYLRQYQPGPLPRVFQTTRIYDRHGNLIGETFDEGRRIWVGLNRISPYLIQATIATEDASFYVNPGIDPARIAGAAIQNLQEGEIVSGASTITMQLARNLFLGPEQRYDQSVDRKVLEAGLAQELTELYTKDEILEMYLNLLNYGQLAYGPEAAAQVYFGKSAADLTLAEATLLAGIPQQPANLNPYQNFDGAKNRQRTVLDLMVRHGYLSPAEADQVYAEPIHLAGDPGLAPNRAPHFVQYVLEELDARFGPGFARRAGFNVYTSLDLEMQELAQQIVAEKVAALAPQYDLSNGALVALKPGSAEILAMVGSADFYNEAIAGQVNVTISLRQPGSAIKPLLYAAALEENLISPASVLWDVPVTYTVGLPTALAGSGAFAVTDPIYRPRNYDNRFHGPVTARMALANSYNVPTVKLLDRLGVPNLLEWARAMGVHSLNRDSSWYGLSLTLGGGEVTLLDLTTAFHTLANGGFYQPPQAILTVTDSRGRVVEDLAPPAPQPVLSPATAFLVTDILSDNAARTPMFGANSPLRLSRPAAAKTGTTSDWRDNWTVGYTRYLVAGVWAGNSDGRPMRNASGITGAAPIWHEFMEAVLARPELWDTLEAPPDPAAWTFQPPPDVVQLPDCPPGMACRQGGEYFSRAWLELVGEEGPLADSVERVPAAPIYVQQGGETRLAAFCRLEGALERTLLRMPGTLPGQDAEDGSGWLAVEGQEGSGAASMRQEQLQVVAWALRQGAPVNLGPCDRLQELVPAALALDRETEDAGMRVLVDLAGATEADPGAPDLATAVELAAIGQLAGGASPGGPYNLVGPVVHNWACPGQYVMGQVVDANGAPVAGVRIRMEDPWGNIAETTSKSGPGDYGQFDFPIYGAGPQDLILTVLDAAGNPVSPPIVIPHKKDAESDTPCHHVVLRGG
ncbi:transglycosylase domain-containing protein [Litorilinea aerophila]|uniref:Uncharacterized protein n=1 Tax=Litorilinea aerophila TaxID=1204385 RepID=A0A540VII5_9CHLR|nr:transglycosylase domain-containing protein [Litorilinea aerophila]MCC9075816.1 transglycosylase domain-containing protein [Litorilinea aerophila]